VNGGLAPVLVADDDDRVAALFMLALREAGYEARRARDGVEALEIIGRSPISLLVLDSRMPRLGGPGVMEALRADAATQRLPIIVVTAEGEVDARVRGLEAGADDYLAKPVDIDELVARVRTHLRSHAAWSDAHQRELAERTRILGAIGQIDRLPRPELTAATIVAHLLEIHGCALAAVLEFVPNGPIVSLASRSRASSVATIATPLSQANESLRIRAAVGPWIEDVRAGDATIFGTFGLDEVVAAPLNVGGRVVGLVVLGLERGLQNDPRGAPSRMLSAAIDSAVVISAVLGPTLGDFDQATARAQLSQVLGDRAFAPVFQPIVTLVDRKVVGYEALTRFSDGTPPDQRFTQAARLGLGMELELAAIEFALDAARALPSGAWLTINASPELLLEGQRIAALLEGVPRKLVLEVTEHAAVDDYAAFRRAIDRLRPLADVAVDDAGAGFASLRHILELGPQLVKLDAALTRGIENDPVRQALVAGFVHFAATARFDLLGEAVETDAEVETLRSLGIGLGQGYLFGRPRPIERRGPSLGPLRAVGRRVEVEPPAA
jgi:EAL domain-containing protein (putative c-di-GMP-specific phosphodiesterase class I)/CheY-like chemotaxis protein